MRSFAINKSNNNSPYTFISILFFEKLRIHLQGRKDDTFADNADLADLDSYT